jgi:hypothetical protein
LLLKDYDGGDYDVYDGDVDVDVYEDEYDDY